MRASLGNLEEGSYAGGLCVEEGSGMGVSPYRGAVGKSGDGGIHLSGISWRRALAMEHISLSLSLSLSLSMGALLGEPGGGIYMLGALKDR